MDNYWKDDLNAAISPWEAKEADQMRKTNVKYGSIATLISGAVTLASGALIMSGGDNGAGVVLAGIGAVATYVCGKATLKNVINKEEKIAKIVQAQREWGMGHYY